MSLKTFYGLTDEAYKKMISDGIIPASRVREHEIYDEFKKRKAAEPSKSNRQIMFDMEEALRVSFATIDKAIYTLRKNS